MHGFYLHVNHQCNRARKSIRSSNLEKAPYRQSDAVVRARTQRKEQPQITFFPCLSLSHPIRIERNVISQREKYLHRLDPRFLIAFHSSCLEGNAKDKGKKKKAKKREGIETKLGVQLTNIRLSKC